MQAGTHLVAAGVAGDALLGGAHHLEHQRLAFRCAVGAHAQVELPRVVVLLIRCAEAGTGWSIKRFPQAGLLPTSQWSVHMHDAALAHCSPSLMPRIASGGACNETGCKQHISFALSVHHVRCLKKKVPCRSIKMEPSEDAPHLDTRALQVHR